MKILVAEYASAIGVGGTCEVEGRAMLSTLVSSFEQSGHEVIYPTTDQTIKADRSVLIKHPGEFENILLNAKVDAGLLIAPDEMQPNFIKILEKNTANLGCSPEAATICADKLLCTKKLKENGIPVVEIVNAPEPSEKGCHQYVIKPRFGCGSEGVRISSFVKARKNDIVTRYHEGLHLSASFIVGDRFLPLTINRQLIEFRDDDISYNGSQVPYNTPRASEIWEVAEKAARVLGLRGYAGIDFVVSDLPRIVDVNARPTTSIIGIAKVMQEELGELIVKARFGKLPDKVHLVKQFTFRKEDLGKL
jgi:predicted ATP-grasp superfamily ATP-dependent carboligase